MLAAKAVLLWGFISRLAPGWAQSADDKPQPLLRIEPGMHTRAITAMAADSAGRYLATADFDRTLRIWDVKTGVLLQTLRLAQGLAASEWSPQRLAFSPDATEITVETDDPTKAYRIKWGSHTIAAVSGGALGKRVAVAANDVPNLGNGIDTDRSGRVVKSQDDSVALYSAGFKKLAEFSAPNGFRPGGVRFSPDGKRVVVGYLGRPRLDVLSGTNLKPLYHPDVSGMAEGDLHAVTFSADGQSLYAGGSFAAGQRHLIRHFTQAGQGAYKDLPATRYPITALWPLPQGGVIYASADPAWGIFSAADELLHAQEMSMLDYHGASLLVDKNGQRVEVAYSGPSGGLGMRFSISDRTLMADPKRDPALQEPRIIDPRLAIVDWQNNKKLSVNGVDLYLDGLMHSLALTPSGKTILIGTQTTVYALDSKKVQQGEGISNADKGYDAGAPGGAFSVNFSGDGNLAVVALGDGTIRWYRASDLRHLLSLFVHRDRKRWVLFTPGGYYDASAGGEALFGWEEPGNDIALSEFVAAPAYRQRYYRPDIIDRVLPMADEWQAVARANYEKTLAAPNNAQTLRPVVTIESPADGSAVEGTEVLLSMKVLTPSGAPLTALRAFVDGRPVVISQPILKSGAGSLRVPLPPYPCTVSVLAENAAGPSDPAMVSLQRPGAAADRYAGSSLLPSLYILAVGVSRYENKDLQLRFAAKDAADLVNVLHAQEHKLYRKVEHRLLTEQQATRENLLDGLQWLQRQTTDKDVAVVFLAGHGIEDPSSGQYYFLPYSADLARPMATMISDVVLREALANLAGKVLLFLDSCHAGKLFSDRSLRGSTAWTRFVSELASAETGVVVLTASTGRQSSQESSEWGNGAFTKALIEGLRGQADAHHTGRVTLDMLDLYVSERVKALTDGQQTPTTAKPSTIPDFPLAVSR